MENKEKDLLVSQLKKIISNKPLDQTFIDYKIEGYTELQEGIIYLSTCLLELNQFMGLLCEGSLNIEPPSRNNVLAGSLKQLHAVLKHLTWQTQQVAKGDYKQRVDFLGEFSEAFNTMICQLEDREIKLKEKSESVSQYMDLLISIMDVHKDWVIVVDSIDKKMIYCNESAKKQFYENAFCRNSCELVNQLINGELGSHLTNIEHYCDYKECYICINSAPIKWQEKDAIVYYLSDVTVDKIERKNLSEIAYVDELTGVYNRRYCIDTIKRYLDNEESFCLVLIDLDGLKFVNDNFGHRSGDEFICTVVEIIQNKIRDTDLVARMGGDEFIILLKGCTEAITREKMNEIYKEVLNTKKAFPLSLSYGITYVPKQQEMNLEEIIESSDKKMYDFKIKNKNPNIKR